MSLMDWIAPISQIAKELATIRALYAADLASRTPPIYLTTEEPREDDTEVMYGQGDPEKSRLRKFMDGDDIEEEDV